MLSALSVEALLIAAVLSGTFLTALLNYFLLRRSTSVGEEIRDGYRRQLERSQSSREWKEASLSELLGPVSMQLDRTGRAFARWRARNVYLESKVIREGNLVIRDLLLAKGHLIPPELLDDAGQLVEHYDRWLEEFERVRESERPELDTPFTFVGPKGYPFPTHAEARFRQRFQATWKELYGPE